MSVIFLDTTSNHLWPCSPPKHRMMIIFFVKNVSSSGVYLKPLYSPVDHTRYINGSTVFFTFIFIGWLLCMVLYCWQQPPLVQHLFHRRAGFGLFLATVTPQTADFDDQMHSLHTRFASSLLCKHTKPRAGRTSSALVDARPVLGLGWNIVRGGKNLVWTKHYFSHTK